MRWRRGRRSSNVEDRRGQSPRGLSSGMKFGGGATFLIAVVVMLMGGDPSSVLQGLGGGGQVSEPAPRSATGNDDNAQFVSAVLADTEDTWSAIFKQYGKTYEIPKLVLFTDKVQSACGVSSAASGPFYCPADKKVYIDLVFFNELSRMGASGDFAQAYVIGHEIGHHVQNITGISTAMRKLQAKGSKAEANALSVRLELQADCYAGVWANHAHNQRQMLESGDVEEGLRAATAIGDDALQKSAGRTVRPESFTHGSSEQRVRWFRAGLQQGNLQACDTFAGL